MLIIMIYSIYIADCQISRPIKKGDTLSCPLSKNPFRRRWRRRPRRENHHRQFQIYLSEN